MPLDLRALPANPGPRLQVVAALEVERVRVHARAVQRAVARADVEARARVGAGDHGARVAVEVHGGGERRERAMVRVFSAPRALLPVRRG